MGVKPKCESGDNSNCTRALRAPAQILNRCGENNRRVVIQTNSSFEPAAPANGSTNYTINALNRIAAAGTANIGYDGRGNLASDGVGSYGYNAGNMLTSATQSGITSTRAYDAENRLASIAKSGATTRFLYDGNALIAEYDGVGNLLRRYVHGSPIGEALVWLEGSGTGDARFFHANEVGTIVSVTDGSGATRSINTYTPYGARSTSNAAYAGRFAFTGQAYLPEIDLHYFKARMYGAGFGRFMQTDPTGYADGLNWYAYAHNDPINRTDPLGLDGVATYPMGYNMYDVLDEVVVSACGRTCLARLEALRDAFIKTLFPTPPTAPRSDCPQVPPAPPSVNINDNIKTAEAHDTRNVQHISTPYGPAPNPGVMSGPTWFYNQVDYAGPWDYKTGNPQGTDLYTDFGNFNFGATGRAVGFSSDELLWGAGLAQLRHDLGNLQVPYGSGTRFDDPRDPPLIEAGIKYYENGCH